LMSAPQLTLDEALKAAAERFGVPYSATHVAFYTEADEREFPAHQTWHIVVPDDDGRATWRLFTEVTYGDALRALRPDRHGREPPRPPPALPRCGVTSALFSRCRTLVLAVHP
jgi:hypothetical protein